MDPVWRQHPRDSALGGVHPGAERARDAWGYYIPHAPGAATPQPPAHPPPPWVLEAARGRASRDAAANVAAVLQLDSSDEEEDVAQEPPFGERFRAESDEEPAEELSLIHI